MTTNGALVVSARNGANKEDGEVSLTTSERLKQKVRSSTPTLAKKKRNFNQREIDSLKLIGQHLSDLGLERTAQLLVEESNCPPDHPLGTQFQQSILGGSWEKAHKTLDELEELADRPEDKKIMHQILAEEKFMELLESGAYIEALWCLRRELVLYFGQTNEDKLRRLSSLMMYRDKEELHKIAGWPGVSGGSRQKALEHLQSYLPATIMLPPRRLQTIFSQALQHQVGQCMYHCHSSESISSYSLLNDHTCSRNQLPCIGVHVLSDHKDEVWFVKFSNDGKRLASGSKDGEVIIWNVEDHPTKLHVIKVQGQGIANLAWSPDDSHILVCGPDDERHVHIYNSETGQLKCRVGRSDDDCLTSCVWQGNATFYCGGLKGHFYECSTEGAVVESWEGVRVQAVCTHPTSKEAIVADSHHRVKSYNFQEPKVTPLIQEEQPIMSMSLSRDGNYLLLNVSNHSLHLWNIKDCTFVERYHGPTQGFYTIHSCFGGHNESFLASGSEDNLVYIWNRKNGSPILKLEGHTRTVNCVSWNPVRHEVLASCSDDGTIRIWGSQQFATKQQEKQHQKQLSNIAESSANGQESLESDEKTVDSENMREEREEVEEEPLTVSDEEDSYNESDNDEEDEEESGNLEHLEEYRLMYVMAMNHPAFRFEDKLQVLSAHSRELEKLLDEKMTLWRTQGEAAGAESIMIKGPQVLPMPPEDARLQSCVVTGAYKRISDKRFVYSIVVSWRDGTRYTIYRPYGEFFTFQSKLLDLFPDEAGGKNKRARVIPFLPGKRFPFSSINSKEKAEKRFPEIVKYVRALMSLPSYITGHSHVRNFFKPHPQDHLLEETLFEKVKAVFDGVMDVDYPSGTDRRSCTLSHESPPSKTSKDRSKTFPSSTMAEQFLLAGRRIIPGTTTVEFTSNPLSPGNVPVGTPVSPSGPVHEGNGVALSEDGHFREGLPSIPEKQGNLQDHTDPSLLNNTNMLTYSTPNMDSGVNTMSSVNPPSIATRGVSSETTSTVSSMTSTPATSPLMTPDMKKRSESCLTINTDTQFSEESFVHWLKSHRLHKYAAIFRGKTLEEILAMQRQDLRKGGMTVGAMNKFQKKINEWRTHLAHSNPSSLQLTISRHPSTFSLPSYLLDRGAGVLGSVSSLEQTPTSSHRRRIASTTSSTSDLAVMDDPIPEIPTLQSKGGTGEVESTAVEQKSVTFKDDETSLDCNSETVDTYPKVPSQSLPPDGVPVPDPSWSGPAGYYPTAGIPVYAGKQFPPTVQIQLGNGTTSTMNGQGQPDGVHMLGIPHQRNLPQPLQGAYGYYPRAIPVNSGHLLRMPTLSTPNGTYIMLPQQQQFFSRPFAAAPVVGGGFSGNQTPTCFNCGQYGHQGQDCTSEGMDSYGGFHKPLGQQGSHLLPNSSQTDHPSGVDPV